MPKRVGNSVYVHCSALEDLSAEQRRQIERAERMAGYPSWNVVRVGQRSVMLGNAPGFGDKAHPALAESWTVTDKVHHRTYSGDTAPVYHRTELMLLDTDSRRPRLEAISKREADAGLLGRPDIGTVGSWKRARRRNPRERSWLPLSLVRALEPEMEARGVSEVARSPRGFLTAYKGAGGNPDRLGTEQSGQPWRDRRNGFVARHMAQAEDEALWDAQGRPSRRHLALIAWAYSPDRARLERYVSRPQQNPAPGYQSYAWTTQDWRVVVPGRSRPDVSWDEKCGSASNRTPSGKVRLCLPLYVIQQLRKSADGREILWQQAQAKQRAAEGARVPWHPQIKELHRKLESKTVKDRRKNPTEASAKTAIRRGGPSMPVQWLNEREQLAGSILDYGSGHGEDAEWLRAEGFRVTAYDPMHGPTRKPTGRYSTILCTYVLNTVSKREADAILADIRKLLKPKGLAFITVRSDVTTGKTANGTYQRDVKLPLDLLGSPGSARIYVMEK